MTIKDAKFVKLDGTTFDGNIEHSADYTVLDGVVFDRIHHDSPHIILVERGSPETPSTIPHVLLHFNSDKSLSHVNQDGSPGYVQIGVTSGVHDLATWAYLLVPDPEATQS